MTDRKPFPREVDEFADDDRVAFDKKVGKWVLEEDGNEWEYSADMKKWLPTLSELEIERQQEAYAFFNEQDETETAGSHKRKNSNGEEHAGQTKKARKPEKQRVEKQNSAIYITSLPLDVTPEEVAAQFARCGVIAEATETGKKRVKLYADEEGNFKGDALVVYHRPESVVLAIQMYDDTDFRYGETGPSGRMTIKPADTSYKKQKEMSTKTGKEKKKIVNSLQKLNNKLADWDDDEPATLPKTSSRYDKVVVLTHMFTLEELRDDPDALREIKEDIEEECAEKFKELGSVANVTVFDLEEEGVATVRFSTVEAANACVKLMNGRHFAGRAVEASIANGSEKFRKNRKKKVDLDEDTDDEEAKRLDKFGDWLENEAN